MFNCQLAEEHAHVLFSPTDASTSSDSSSRSSSAAVVEDTPRYMKKSDLVLYKSQSANAPAKTPECIQKSPKKLRISAGVKKVVACALNNKSIQMVVLGVSGKLSLVNYNLQNGKKDSQSRFLCDAKYISGRNEGDVRLGHRRPGRTDGDAGRQSVLLPHRTGQHGESACAASAQLLPGAQYQCLHSFGERGESASQSVPVCRGGVRGAEGLAGPKHLGGGRGQGAPDFGGESRGWTEWSAAGVRGWGAQCAASVCGGVCAAAAEGFPAEFVVESSGYG